MNVKKTKKFKENRPENCHVHDNGFHEGLDYQLVHLAIQGLVGDVRVRLDQRDEDRSEFGVHACNMRASWTPMVGKMN